MKKNWIHLFFTTLILVSCDANNSENTTIQNKDARNTKESITPETIYETESLRIEKLSDHTYMHVSFLNTESFGRVSCNGMFVVDEGECIVFDSPVDSISSVELISFINQEFGTGLRALIPTHFHLDCIGGIEVFEHQNVPIYIDYHTADLIGDERDLSSESIRKYEKHLVLSIGSGKIHTDFFGEGHTKDNLVSYYTTDNAVFGGCLIKAVGAGKGNLEDANTSEWSKTVEKIKEKYADARIVIPGHGSFGDAELFDYTIELFSDN